MTNTTNTLFKILITLCLIAAGYIYFKSTRYKYVNANNQTLVKIDIYSGEVQILADKQWQDYINGN